MEITEVRIKIMDEPGERLQAFCSITFDDCFVIRDLKIIEGTNGPFVAMPSRKLASHCPQCRSKNHLRAAYCNNCGLRLKDDRAIKDTEGRAKLYADIAHPINTECREMIQSRVIQEFREEQELSKRPGYVSRYDDFDIDDNVPDASRDRGVHSPKEKTRTEPAAQEPRAPHTPADQPEKRTHDSPAKPRGIPNGSENNPGGGHGSEFGAGIF